MGKIVPLFKLKTPNGDIVLMSVEYMQSMIQQHGFLPNDWEHEEVTLSEEEIIEFLKEGAHLKL